MLANPEELIGRVLGGYRLERLLNTGVTGVVFLGHHTAPPQPQVVIKIGVVPSNASSEDRANFQARFRREAQVLQHLHHPHILSILAFGAEADLNFVIFPYMEGGTLAHRLARQEGPRPLHEVSVYLTQLATALDYAHAQGITHGDIKPANILLDAQGRPYLADFSIVRFTDLRHTILTGPGQVLGTPAYLAPEQVDGRNVGPAADIYSLGVVVYELVTGRLPFQAVSLTEYIRKHAHDAPTSPRQLRPDLPRAAEEALMVALAKRPEERFPSAGAFAQAFALGLQGQWAPGLKPSSVITDSSPTGHFTPPPTVWSSPVPTSGPGQSVAPPGLYGTPTVALPGYDYWCEVGTHRVRSWKITTHDDQGRPLCPQHHRPLTLTESRPNGEKAATNRKGGIWKLLARLRGARK